jgi:hypothetical protein
MNQNEGYFHSLLAKVHLKMIQKLGSKKKVEKVIPLIYIIYIMNIPCAENNMFS